MNKKSSLLEAWETIKDVELTHMTYDSDENYDGEWEYEAVEVDDGTIEDNFPDECKLIESVLKDKEQIDMLLEQFGLNNIQNFIDNLKIVAREQKQLNVLDVIKEKLYSWSKLYINTDEQRVSNVLTIYDIDNKEKKLLNEVLEND